MGLPVILLEKWSCFQKKNAKMDIESSNLKHLVFKFDEVEN